MTPNGEVVDINLSDYLLSENEMRVYATTTVNAHINDKLDISK